MHSVGAVIKDGAGRVTVALSKHLPLPLEPLEAKAKALEKGVFFAWVLTPHFTTHI